MTSTAVATDGDPDRPWPPRGRFSGVRRGARTSQELTPLGSANAGDPVVGVTRRRRLMDSGVGVARRAAQLPANLPPGVQDQIKQSVKRLTKVRSLKSAKRVLVEEAERLFLGVTPLLAAAPLPLTGWRARMAAGTTGGAAALVEQAEEIAAVVSWGGALPGAPLVAGAVISGWVLELWIAVSARVNQLKAAGRQVDADLLGRELAGAYLGDPDAVRRLGTARVVRAVARKAAERWAAGLVPGVGIAFDTFTSQRTVARILREPLSAHPLAN
ncbi:MAG: hypothetical protein QOE07_2452 [Acidimicrobiaceae bacterium]|nr:hypothetical protein [Acidimicrobiaceae bacterium]